MSGGSSNICTKTINEIQEEKCCFFIPDYQRGYRWTRQQVEDLLEDLNEFDQQNPAAQTFYCLQPVVVKPILKDGLSMWEVIDGQQRLTTIYILLSYFHEMMPMVEVCFSIDYQTRLGSLEYLKNISKNAFINEESENIDYFHMKTAYCMIDDWFSRYSVAKASMIVSLYKRLSAQTRVIWYEPDPMLNSADIFTRINIGKIPLTNAELIKALFLRKDNFIDDELGRFNPYKQLEIAGEWDGIEYSLQNDQIWYFLTDGSILYETRIDFLFDILAEQKNKKDIIGEQLNPKHTMYFSFVVFVKYLEKKTNDSTISDLAAIKELWLEVKRLFMTFEEWYSSREWYHYIGYLVSTGAHVKNIWHSAHGLSKSKLQKKLQSDISKTIHFEGEIENLSYKTDYSIIKRILLLFNIESLQSSINSQAKFEFSRYKKDKWDLEHIHSLQSEEIPVKQRVEWLQTLVDGVPDNSLRMSVLQLLKRDSITDEEFLGIYKDAINRFGEYGNEEELNGLGNITLLDSGTNRAYKNAIFPIKRKFIIERDKLGVFVPLCTKNVFLKYYSAMTGDMLMWSKKDREDYLNDIKNTLSKYLNFKEV